MGLCRGAQREHLASFHSRCTAELDLETGLEMRRGEGVSDASVGSTSRMLTARSTASSAEPPHSSTVNPASAARDTPALERAHSASGMDHAPPWQMITLRQLSVVILFRGVSLTSLANLMILVMINAISVSDRSCPILIPYLVPYAYSMMIPARPTRILLVI